jgi:NAD(P)-dependent dehydrogenase (short-subunit alcohol dehydrogenase family)
VKVLIIGASKGIGLATTKAALAAGYDVRAFARSAAAMTLSDPRLEKVQGDATRQKDVEAALARQVMLASPRGGYITPAEAEEAFYAKMNTLDMVA